MSKIQKKQQFDRQKQVTLVQTRTDDHVFNKLQNEVQQSINELDTPFSGGVTINVSVSSQTTIEHKLARTPKGWIITDQTSDGSVYRVKWDSKFIILDTQSPTPVDLTIYIY